jgi:hypothetical protein
VIVVGEPEQIAAEAQRRAADHDDDQRPPCG